MQTLSGDKDQRVLYAADGHNERVHIPDRQTLAEIPGSAFGLVGHCPGQFVNIHVIASDSKGNLCIGNDGGRFQKLVYQGMSR